MSDDDGTNKSSGVSENESGSNESDRKKGCDGSAGDEHVCNGNTANSSSSGTLNVIENDSNIDIDIRNISAISALQSGSLKLQTNTPNLVSFGRGRLSTTVTLHPITNGQLLVGSAPNCDILIEGSGVQPFHCIIENRSDIVTLYPKADQLFVDGKQIHAPTRLTQGSILTIGRSNYLKFNHPTEAERIRSALPNARLSMASIDFDVTSSGDSSSHVAVTSTSVVTNGSDAGSATTISSQKLKKKPPTVPKKFFKEILANYNGSSNSSSGGGGGGGGGNESSSKSSTKNRIMSKVYKFENLAQQQQQEKIASMLLCPKVFSSDSVTVNTPAKDVLGKIPPTDLKQFAKNLPQSYINYSESLFVNNKIDSNKLTNLLLSDATTSFTTTTSSTGNTAAISTAYNQSPNIRRKFNSFEKNQINSIQNSLSSQKFDKTADKENNKEQDVEKAKIEEVLYLCAEYEKQNQNDKSTNNNNNNNKPNRIITNGSLPREQKNNSSPKHDNPLVLDADKSKQLDTITNNASSCYDNLSIQSNNCNKITQQQQQQQQQSSSYVNYEQNNPPVNGSCPISSSSNSNSYSSTLYKFPPSPRTKIKTFLTPSTTTSTSSCSSSSNTTTTNSLLPDLKKNPLSNLELFEKMFPDENDSVSKKSLIDLNREIVHELRAKRTTIVKQMNNYKRLINDLKTQQEEIISDMELEQSLLVGEYQSNLKELKSDRVIRDKIIEKLMTIEKLAEQRQKLQAKHQEESKERTEQIEQAIRNIENELKNIPVKSSSYTILLEELNSLREQADSETKNFEDLEFHFLEEEAEWLATREELQRTMNELNVRIGQKNSHISNIEKEKDEIIESVRNDLYDADAKIHENLKKVINCQDEINFLDEQVKALKNDDDFAGVEDADGSAAAVASAAADDLDDGLLSSASESSNDEFFDEHFSFVRNSTPKLMTQSLNDSFLRGENQKTIDATAKFPSQDDIDRISRITSNAPIDNHHGSLGKQTLREIERGRQLHLEENGSDVIEQERQRVTELKKRVQNEVRAEWARNRSREDVSPLDHQVSNSDSNSCYENETKINNNNNVNQIEDVTSAGSTSDHHQQQQQLRTNLNSRPLSEVSEISFETTTVSSGDLSEVRLRNKPKNIDPQQRPLTRFLPIRNSDLNLYAHIRSSGHQIETCSFVKIDSFSCRGYLQKMGSRFHTWHKRWFVFDRKKRTFMYYTDKNEKKIRGGAYFQNIEEVYLDHNMNAAKSSPGQKLVFVVKTRERSFHLMAPSSESLRIWVDVLITGAEGYLEFNNVP